MPVDKDTCDLVQRCTPDFKTVFGDLQKSAIPREMPSVRRNIYNLIHWLHTSIKHEVCHMFPIRALGVNELEHGLGDGPFHRHEHGGFAL